MSTDIQNRNEQSWWSRPCGVRDVLVLSLPLIVSMISWTVMNFTNRMFLLWYSLPAMASALPAGMLYFSLVCFPMGVVAYVNTFVAQYHGAKRPERAGAAVGQAMRIGLYVAPLFLLFIPVAPYFFRAAGHEPYIAALETVYFQALVYGAGATVLSTAQLTFFTGRGAMKAVMGVDVTAAVLNIVLDYLLIFGNFGFPEMGIEGAAFATVVAEWTKVFLYAVLMARPHYSIYQLAAGRRYDRKLFWRIMRFGLPSGLQFAVDVVGITLFVMLVGRFGSEAMVATTLAFNVNSVAFVPVYGLGIAVTTMVGQQIGRNRPDAAAQATWSSYRVALVYTGTMALLYVFAPDLFLFGHKMGISPDEFHRLRDMTAVLLRFVACYALFDTTAVVFMSAIKGAGDTRFILCTTALTAPSALLLCTLGVSLMGWALIWCWVVFTVWISALGLIYFARFLQGRWKSMRVIESVDEVEPAERVELEPAVV